MKLFFSRDDNRAIDSPDLDAFLFEKFGCYFSELIDNKIAKSGQLPLIKFHIGDEEIYIWVYENTIYLVEFSCGVYESLYELTEEDLKNISRYFYF